jgi:hypothetical protein
MQVVSNIGPKKIRAENSEPGNAVQRKQTRPLERIYAMKRKIGYSLYFSIYSLFSHSDYYRQWCKCDFKYTAEGGLGVTDKVQGFLAKGNIPEQL